MSSIEKAMDKLAGREPQADEEGGAEEEPRSGTGPTRPPERVGDESTGPAGGTPAMEPAAARKGRYVQIDFARLMAAGYLTPETDLLRLAEEYQYIKRRMLGNIALGVGTDDRPSNLIMITSSVPGEGKTFTTLNLAMSITYERDHTILVVDTDIMKRDLSRQLNLENEPGLYDYLDGQVQDIADVIYRTNVPNLAVIPSGRYKPSSTELLASARMLDLVNEFASRYRDRVVLFDTPPLLATTTAIALAPQVGQLVLVVEAGETKTTTLEEALRVLDRVPVTGMVLNKSKGSSLQPHNYYGDYYAKPPAPG